MSNLSKQTIPDTEHKAGEFGEHILHVRNPHSLIQAIGYLKHIAEPYERVFFRGQSSLYKELCPTIYRDIEIKVGQQKRHAWLKKAMEQICSQAPIVQQVPEYAREALLQHYGYKTTWLDLVDNVWIALWFAVYQAHTVGRNNEYLHFEKREVSADNRFGYILLVAIDESKHSTRRKGMIVGNKTELIDLRIAAPSMFLRPHAQHGLLFRLKGNEQGREIDYLPQVRGILRFNLEAGIKWLGSGTMHEVRSLFPPPYFDQGYKILLGCNVSEDRIGCVHHIGA